MKQVIIYRDRLEQCYSRIKELKLSPQNCILISNSMGNQIKQHLIGYWNEVMNDKILLDGLTKEQFDFLYHGGTYPSKTRYIETELKSTSLAGKKLKIIKGYLQGQTIKIEDWFIKTCGGVSWKHMSSTNPCAFNYGFYHQSEYDFPNEATDWVLYGKIGALGYLVNVNELKLPKDYDVKKDYVYMEIEHK